MVNVMSQNNKILEKIADNKQRITALEAQVEDQRESINNLLLLSENDGALIAMLFNALKENGFIEEMKTELQVINGGKL